MDAEPFATPQLRQGPTSRLLKRRSQAAAVAAAASPVRSTVVSTERRSVADSILQEKTKTADVGYQYDVTMGNSTVMANVTNFGDFSKSVLAADETTYGVTPHLRATDNLYVDFLATVCEESSGLAALDQVAEMEELISGHDAVIKKFALSAVNKTLADQPRNNMLAISKNFVNERNTWRLLGKLYQDRLTPNDDEEEILSAGMARTSEKMLISKLFRSDRDLREGQIVVDWLEMNARHDFESKARMDYFSDGQLAFENTLGVLKDQSKGTSTYRRPIVSQIDPDAPRREGRPMHDLDVQDQHQMLKTMFLCVRAGLLETAQDLAVKMGQSWRAAALEGWKLFHDPNYDAGDRRPDEKSVAEGNKNRDIWKKVVWKMIQDDKMGLYERAVLAPFCGHVGFLLANVCTEWEDCLWALTKCMVDLRVETEIREKMVRSFADLPREYWAQNKTSFDEVFSAVAAYDDPLVREQGGDPFRVVQKGLILGRLDELLDTMDGWTEDCKITDPQLLRFLAHVVIVLRRLVPTQVDFSKGQNVLKHYVQFLVSKDRINQVAWYTAQLPSQTQVDLYAKFLESVHEDADRRLAISLAVEANLPVKSAKSQVVENVLALDSMINPDTGDEDLELLVKKKIDVLSWLLYDLSQRDEAIYQTNNLVRTLVASEKFDSAKVACFNLPADTIPVVTNHCTNDSGELESKQANAIAEHLCWQNYFKAKEAFSDWFEHFHRGKPIQPVLPDNPSFTHRAAHGEKTKQYTIDLERWQSSQDIQSKEACDRLESTITVSGGWLVDPHTLEEGEGDEADRQRLLEVDYLRRLCLPQLVLLLHTVLHSTGQYEKAVGVADLVASEQHCLYEVYVQDNMRELMQKLRQSSLEAMASSTLDAWGHQTKS